MKDYLNEEAKELGKRAVEQGLIPSFDVWDSPDGTTTFYIPEKGRGEPLTVEQAHSHLKNLLGIS